MQIDALTLAAVADELRSRVVGARVEDVIAPTPHAIALQLYAPGLRAWLIASAHPQLARLHLASGKPRKLTSEPSPFVMLLRKHLEGARIVAVRQPAWERVLELGFARAGGAEPTIWLVAELMGRHSNLVLRDATGEILGALVTVGADVNLYRAIQPHVAYREPPPQTRQLHGASVPRMAPETLTGEALREAAVEMLAAPVSVPSPRPGRRRVRNVRNEGPTVATLLASQVAGWSRELGREVAVRALGEADVNLALDLPWEALAAEVRRLAALTETHTWQPTLVTRAEGAAEPIAFAVYEPRQYPGARLVPMPSANELLAAYFEGAEWRASVEGAKGTLRHVVQAQRDRCERKEQVLRAELAALDEAARLREEADTLLAFQTEVPAHAASVTLPNPFVLEGEATVTLVLDPRYSAVENANRRYHRYHKLQRATGHIPAQLDANALELARIAQLATDLELAETSDEITHVRRELAEAGYLREKPDARLARKPSGQGKQAKGKVGDKKGAKAGQAAQRVGRAAEGGTVLRRQSADGFTLLIGKNSRQNEEVTFHQATGNDLWLHARGVPGAHVIVKSGGRPVSEVTIRQAAALAAYYSQARAAGSVPVDVTEQRYVRHLKGGGPGMVTYERERTIHVAPSDAPAS